MADRKYRYAVLTYFEKQGVLGNKAKTQWDADNLLESYSLEKIKQVIDYFFKVSKNPTWKNFVYNFDSYLEEMLELKRDEERRRVNRARLREWAGE